MQTLNQPPKSRSRFGPILNPPTGFRGVMLGCREGIRPAQDWARNVRSGRARRTTMSGSKSGTRPCSDVVDVGASSGMSGTSSSSRQLSRDWR